MERQITQRKCQNHNHQHPNDAPPCPQNVVRRMGHLRQLGAVPLVEAILRPPRRHHHLVGFHGNLHGSNQTVNLCQLIVISSNNDLIPSLSMFLSYLTLGDSGGPLLVFATRLSVEIVRVVGRGGVLQSNVPLQPPGAFPQCYRYPAVQDLSKERIIYLTVIFLATLGRLYSRS